MTYSLTQFAYQALRDIGCLRAGQTTSPDILNDILVAGNNMLDSWLLDRLMVYADDGTLFTLTAGKQSYKIGPTGGTDLIAPRPTQIDDANLVLSNVSPPVRLPISIINEHDWSLIAVQNIPFAIPLRLYYDKGFDSVSGFGTINLWPGPLLNYQLELFTWHQLQMFANLSTPYSFPPGYAKAIQKNLAVEIAPMMAINAKLGRTSEPNKSLLELVVQQAREAKAEVQSYNAPEPLLTCDPAWTGKGQSSAWSYATGQSMRRR